MFESLKKKLLSDRKSFSFTRGTSLKVYVFILVLAVAMVLFTKATNYFVSDRITKKTIESNNRYISYVSRTIDEQVCYISNILYKYLSQEDVKKIANRWTGKYEEYRTTNDIQKNIGWNIIENDLLFDIIISFRDQPFIINKDGYYSNSFFFTNFVYDGIIIDEYDTGKIRTLDRKVAQIESNIIQIQENVKLIVFSYYGEKFKINVLINYDKFLESVIYANYDKSNSVLIMDNNNNVLLNTLGEEVFRANLHEFFTGRVEAPYSTTIDDSQYIVNMESSKQTGWQYVVLYPYDEIQRDVTSLNAPYNVTYIIVIILGIALAFYFKNKIMNPIKEMIEKYNPVREKRSDNEFIMIKNVMELMKNENDIFGKFMVKNQGLLRKKLLESLLLNGIEITYVDKEQYLQLFTKNNFFLLHFKVIKMGKWNIKNVISEITSTLDSTNVIYETILVGKMEFFMVLNSYNSVDAAILFIERKLVSLRIEGLDIFCLLTSPAGELNTLKFAMAELDTIRKYRNIRNDNFVFTKRDIVNQKVFTHNFESFKEHLKQRIYNGEVGKVKQLLDNNSILDKDISLKEARQILCLIVSVIGEIKATKISCFENTFGQEKWWVEDIPDHPDGILQMFDGCVDVCLQFADSIACERDNENNEIIQYIRDNFSNYISLELVADHFKMNRNYLCSYIKEKIGITFTEYMNKLRIEIAKKEILNTEKTVSLIAKEVGFENTSSFIRFFKKIEGCTPGNFRNRR